MVEGVGSNVSGASSRPECGVNVKLDSVRCGVGKFKVYSSRFMICVQDLRFMVGGLGVRLRLLLSNCQPASKKQTNQHIM